MYTSITCLPASLAVSNAAWNSPFINCPNALPAKPKTSVASLKVLINLCFIMLPSSNTFSFGFSNKSLKNPVTEPILSLKNLKKSLNAILKNSVPVLKPSTTLWFCPNMSLSCVNAANIKPTPNAFNPAPKPLTAPVILLNPVSPSFVALFKSLVWSTAPLSSSANFSTSLAASSILLFIFKLI